jgi:hypothetical protein
MNVEPTPCITNVTPPADPILMDLPYNQTHVVTATPTPAAADPDAG